MTKTNIHGGDLELIARKYNIKQEELINFGGNVNPLGISKSIKNAIIENIDCLCRYPDISYLSLRKSISNYIKTDPEYIIPGNGATELISLFIKTVSPKSAIIIAPSYSEYEKCVKINNGNVIYFPLKEENNFNLNIDEFISFIPENTDMIILCNPNNPTGTAINMSNMEIILNHCLKNNIYIMTDETYIEFTDPIENLSSVPLVSKYKNLFVVRGTAKFFAAPGLRLGYGICSNKKIIDAINSKKDPWSVNILASVAGKVMFSDNAYIDETKKIISEERKKIINNLKSWKHIKVFESKANFVLLKMLDTSITSNKVFEKMLLEKMIIRDASDFACLEGNYLRFCFLMPEQNEALINHLKAIVNNDK